MAGLRRRGDLVERKTLPTAQAQAAGDETHFGTLNLLRGPMAENDVEWRRGVTEAIWGHNGNKGLIVDVNTLCGRMETFIATVETRETERKSAAERSERKVNWLIAVLTLAAIAIGSLAAVLALGHPNRVQSVLENLSTSQYQYTLAERTTK